MLGIAASDGVVYSTFEVPEQSYALLPNAPGMNIDASNHASIVHRDPLLADGAFDWPHRCDACGATAAGWQDRCEHCRRFNTLRPARP